MFCYTTAGQEILQKRRSEEHLTVARHANSYEYIAKLIARAQAGDRAAFEEAYRLTAQAQYFTIMSKVGASAAADLLQEVYLIAWKNRAKIRPRAFVGYLNTVSRNVCLRYRERMGRLREASSGAAELQASEQHDDRGQTPEHITDPADIASGRDEGARLAAALRSELDDREREVILMRFYQDMGVAAIAENLDVSESTVKRTIKRALSKLRDKLGALPFGPALSLLLQQAVEDPLADGARPRAVHRTTRPVDWGVRIVSAAACVAAIGCLGLVAAGHLMPNAGPATPETIGDPGIPLAETVSDTAPPTLEELRLEHGVSVVCLRDESGIASVTLTAEDGTVYRSTEAMRASGEDAVWELRLTVPSGAYALTATDCEGNVATGEVTVDFPPSDPGPYTPAA